jgi:glucosylceramidase
MKPITLSSHPPKFLRPILVTMLGLLPSVTFAESVDPEPPLAPTPPEKVQVWLTSYDASKKLQKQTDLTWSATQPVANFNVAVDESIKFQQMDGFGATITDPAIWNADPAVRDEIMRLLFSRGSGIGLNMMRVGMRTKSPSGVDMTYNDVPRGETDPTLSKFSIAYDLQWKIPMMQRAKELNPELTLMATPWSAPAWMKDSNAAGYGKLLPRYHSTYADYFVKFIQAWRDHGLGISAVTLQNEPHYEPYSYPGMRMEPDDQIALALQMGPAFQNAGLSTRIICWDHNFDEYNYPIEVLDDPAARQWIDGSAFHAYAGDPNNMSLVKAAHPDKNLYFTEQTGSYPGDGFGSSVNWHVKNLFMIPGWNHSRCTLLWQLALASTNLAGDRPFVRVAADGKSFELFGEYYETGHFSKFIRKGAYRIDAATATNGRPRTIAYQNPDGSKVLVALNDSSTAVTISIQDKGRWISYPLTAGSLATFTWRDTTDGNGLAATYFDNPDLTGITESRIDPTVDFNWGSRPPDCALGTTGFSARWRGMVKPQFSELHTFHPNTSGGVRLWVNQQLIIDNWSQAPSSESSGSILLAADQAVEIQMEYYSVSGNSTANLAWSSASTPKQTIPRSRLYAPTAPTLPPPPLQLLARAPGNTVSLTWKPSPTATSYTVKRSTTQSGPYAEIANGITTTSFTDSLVSEGITYHYTISATNSLGSGANSAPASETPSTVLSFPWASQDIGSVNSAGGAGSIGSSIKLSSTGNDLWGTADSFHFAHLPMTGDGTIVARVATQESTHEWAKAGIMMRESLAANSAHASLVLSPRNGAALFTRASTGAASTFTNRLGPFAPHWLKLVRTADTFTGFSSPDGLAWTQLGMPITVTMKSQIHVGLANASRVTATNISTFDSISAPGIPTPPPLAPAGLTANSGNESVGLSWKASAYAKHYNVKRAIMPGGPYTTITAATTTVYIDNTAINGTTYYYAITAVNPSGESVTSREVRATPSSLLLPPGWANQDIGAVGFTGGASYSAGTFSIKGSGSDIWGMADGFNYCYQTVSGEGTIIARVTSVQNTSSYAKASVMFRESLLANSAHASMQVNPNGSVDLTYRTATGSSSADAGWTGIGMPKWLKLVRSGTSFSGYYSSDGSSWTQLGAAITIPLPNDMLAGMAVSAVNNSALNSSTLDNVSLTGFGAPITPSGLSASQLLGGINLQWNTTQHATTYSVKRATASGGPYTTIATSPANSFTDLSVANRSTYYYVISALNELGESGNSSQASATSYRLPLPTGWLDKDIGSVGLTGNADYENGEFTVRGSGTEIWSSADNFNFCYRPVSGSSTISARVSSLQNTSSTAKAGLIFRDSHTATAARYAMISVSPSEGIKFEYRSSNNGIAHSVGTATATAPVYLRLTRTNNNFTAFYSLDGVAWTQLGPAVNINKMPSSAYQGFAVCAANNAALNTATFDQVSAFNYTPPTSPQNLSATVGDGGVVLNWSTIPGATSYHVKRASSGGGPYTTMANPTGSTYTDSQVFKGATYHYVVSALTAGAESANSEAASATVPLPLPEVPLILVANATGNQIALAWAPSAGAEFYNIKRATTSGGPYSSIASTHAANYLNTNLDYGVTYHYVVSAVNRSGESDNSTEIPGTTSPTAPTGLTATHAPAQLTLNWSTSPHATSYWIKRSSISGGPYATIASGVNASFIDRGLNSNKQYYYVISAVNAAGESADSTQVGASPLPPTPSTWVGAGTATNRATWSTTEHWTGTIPSNGSTVEGLIFSNTGNSWSNNDLADLTVNGFTMLSSLPTRDNNLVGNPIRLIGDVTVSTGSWQTVGIDITLRGTRTFSISSGTVFLNGQLSDDSSPGGIVKSGGAELLISGTNAFTAAKRLTLNNGTVTLENPTALGAAVANTTDRSIEFGTGANTVLQFKTDTPANKYNLGGGSTSASTTISLGRKTVGNGHMQDFGFLDSGNRTITFNQGANVNSGNMVANLGDLRMTAGNNDRPLSLAGTATMNVASASITSTANTKRLQLDGTSHNNTIGTISNGLAGANLQVIKNNNGTWTLSGNSSYTGGTTVNAGKLIITGMQNAATGAITVGDGITNNGTASLGGTGTLGGAITVQADGILAPGVTIGNLTSSSSLALDGTLSIEINGPSSDQLTVFGNLKITKATLNFSILANGATEPEYVIASFASLTGTAFDTVVNKPPDYEVAYDLVNRQIKLVKSAGFEAWIAGFSVTDFAATADPDRDGLANVIEYVLGGNPSQNSVDMAPTAQSSSTDFTYTFRRNDSSETNEISLFAEFSPDLAEWPMVLNIGPDAASSSPGVQIEENGTDPDTITVSIPIGTRPRKFARLRVAVNP